MVRRSDVGFSKASSVVSEILDACLVIPVRLLEHCLITFVGIRYQKVSMAVIRYEMCGLFIQELEYSLILCFVQDSLQ